MPQKPFKGMWTFYNGNIDFNNVSRVKEHVTMAG